MGGESNTVVNADFKLKNVWSNLISIYRLFWILNMLTVSTLSCMIIWLLYCRFEETPTRITIENQFESVYNLPYPAITLCSPNQLSMSAVKHFKRTLVNGNLTMDLEETLPLLLGYYEVVEDVKEDILTQLQHLFNLNRYSIAQGMGILALNCEKFLKGCFLEGKRYQCKELFQPIITSHGYCCTFNSKYFFNGERNVENAKFKIRTVNRIGLHSSLTVVTDYEPLDALPNTLLNAASVKIMLTDWTEFPVDYESFLVDANGEAFLFLRATYTYCSESVKLLAPWSRSCYFENEYNLDVFHKYRNSDCDHMCFVLAVNKTCNCWLFTIPNVKLKSMCKVTQIPCIMSVKKNMSYWLMTEQCICPRDCESRKYRADLNVGNLQAMPYMIESQNLFAGMKFNASSSIINFLFATPVYVKQKQETVISIINLVSNLGGVFGLFMGCSGISALEILFYVYIGIRNYVHKEHANLRRNAVGHYQ